MYTSMSKETKMIVMWKNCYVLSMKNYYNIMWRYDTLNVRRIIIICMEIVFHDDTLLNIIIN